MTRVCLVTGATGAIGPSVVDALGREFSVRTLSRRLAPPGLFGSGVTAMVGDVTDADAVARAVRGAEVVVHLASLLHLVNPPPHMRREYERVNVTGTAVVAEAARSEGVSRLVIVSTIAVYGKGQVATIDEDSAPAPDTIYGETKLAAERIALEARRHDGAPLSTVLRSAAVYGPRIKGNYRRLVQALARRRFVPIGRGENRRTLVYETDLASAVALSAVHPAAAGRIYNVSDGDVHRLRTIIDAISTALGRRAPRWHLPVSPIRASLALASALDRGRRLPLGLSTLDKYLEECAVRASRIQDELGFRPRITLERGWRETVELMRKNGEIAAGA